MNDVTTEQGSVAEALLRALKKHGIDHVFANAGTDFAPVIEALTRLAPVPDSVPRFLTVPHENLALAMAHGYYCVAGKPAAAMVHVTVGTANAICALMNAHRDNIPLLLMAGRTPLTQAGHIASRSAPIHWGQESFDQAGIVREHTKWDYELRAGQSAHEIVGRALEVALAEPRGPVYLTLPREVLANVDSSPVPAPPLARADAAAPQPSTQHLETAAQWIAQAEWPLIVTSHFGRDPAAVAELAALADAHAIPVAQAGARCLNLPASHPMNLGQATPALLERADLIVVLDSEVPWFPRSFTPAAHVKVVHLGVDPLWVRLPMRAFPAHLVVPGSSRAAVTGLAAALRGAGASRGAALERRRGAVAKLRAQRAAETERAVERARNERPIRYAYLAACLGAALPPGALVVGELGVSLEQLALEEPGSFIGSSLAGGLGLALGQALGAKLAAPERVVVATVGDGSYMFGNPTPFHLVARAADLPVLTIVCNNGRWQAVESATRVVYPDGVAARAEPMPLVELQPSPEFSKVAEASDAFARRVDDPAELPGAIRQALDAVQNGRQALLDVRMEHGQR